jgi:core-2/I-Branching enzyme
MKIAYLTLVHDNPGVLKRLIAALLCKDCGFFVHIDRKVDIRQFSGIGGDNIFLSGYRVPVYHSGFSMVEATLLLLREALSRRQDNDYFILLSGTHYPLQSKEYIHRFLEHNLGSEFISMARMPNEAFGMGLSKLNRIYFEEDEPVRRFLSRVLAKVALAQRDHRKYLRILEPYGGSQWWALTREACQYIIEFVQSNEGLSGFFRNTCCPDEMFFHTILGNSPFRSRVRRNLTYLHWPVGERPSILNSAHMRQIELRDRQWIDDEWGSGEALFARKFSDDNLKLLDQIDEMIARKGACEE